MMTDVQRDALEKCQGLFDRIACWQEAELLSPLGRAVVRYALHLKIRVDKALMEDIDGTDT